MSGTGNWRSASRAIPTHADCSPHHAGCQVGIADQGGLRRAAVRPLALARAPHETHSRSRRPSCTFFPSLGEQLGTYRSFASWPTNSKGFTFHEDCDRCASASCRRGRRDGSDQHHDHHHPNLQSPGGDRDPGYWTGYWNSAAAREGQRASGNSGRCSCSEDKRTRSGSAEP